jgi:hypothetical protein
MIRNGYAMRLPTYARLQADMTANLAVGLITVAAQQSYQIVTGKITRQSQTGMTSSFTRCRRITDGALPFSK